MRNFFNNLDEELENDVGISTKSVAPHVAQQTKAVTKAATKSIVNMLYGVKDTTEPTEEDKEEIKNEARVSAYSPFQSPEQAQQRQLNQLKERFPGINTEEEQTEYMQAQQKLAEFKKNEIEIQRLHSDYYRNTVGTLDDKMVQNRKQKEKEDEDIKEEEEQQKKEKEEEEKQQRDQEARQFAAKSRKVQMGRNKMGSNKANMDAMDETTFRSQRKAEMSRGSTG